MSCPELEPFPYFTDDSVLKDKILLFTGYDTTVEMPVLTDSRP